MNERGTAIYTLADLVDVSFSERCPDTGRADESSSEVVADGLCYLLSDLLLEVPKLRRELYLVRLERDKRAKQLAELTRGAMAADLAFGDTLLACMAIGEGVDKPLFKAVSKKILGDGGDEL